MSKTENAFDPATLREEFVFAGYGSVISLSIYFILDWLDIGGFALIIQAFVLLGLIIFVSQAYWKGTTFLSVLLEGERRQRYQIVLSIITPLLLLVIFCLDAEKLNFQAFEDDLDWYFLVPIGIISYISWFSAPAIHNDHPFRGFVLSSAIIFVLLYLPSKGVSFGTNDDMDVEPISKDELKATVEYGVFAIKYFVYVVTSYVVMIARIKIIGGYRYF
jgi:hypothetical protein